MEFINAQRNAFDTIDCEINHPIYGWIPFTADPNDTGAHFDVAELFARMEGEAAPYVAPKPNPAAICAQARAQRNALLQQSDWTQVSDAPVDQAAWATYRQGLRDITAQAGFPENINWPTRPE